MVAEFQWLPVEVIIQINKEEVAKTGEPHQVASYGELESAAHRPMFVRDYGEQDDPVLLAVALLYSLVRNHPFTQGNKRTAITSCLLFLEINGCRYDGKIDQVILADQVLKLVNDEITEYEFSEILRPHIYQYT